MKRLAAAAFVLSIAGLAAGPALAQFGLPSAGSLLPGVPSVGGGSSSGSGSSAGAPASAAGGTAPVTYRNMGHKFHFTIPAGWALDSGDANGDSVVFHKGSTTRSFTFHFTAMSPDFPAEASVKASLNSAKTDIKLGKNIDAKRRDEKCESNPKNICARGWELIDNGDSGPQRIIFQAYDKANTYYNFNASAEKPEFPAARAELQAIIDSIKFE